MYEMFVGIDVGLGGGLAFLGNRIQAVRAVPVITGVGKGKGKGKTKDILDIKAVRDWLMQRIGDDLGLAMDCTNYAIPRCIVGLEQATAMPKQGVSSMFSFGMTYGMLRGLLSALDIPTVIVRPKTWKDKILFGTQKDKAAAIQYVRSRYPAMSLRATERCTTDHDGMADAVCIAEYMKRENGHAPDAVR